MHIKIVVLGYFIHKIHDQFICIFSCQTIFPLFFGQNSQKFCARCFLHKKIENTLCSLFFTSPFGYMFLVFRGLHL